MSQIRMLSAILLVAVGVSVLGQGALISQAQDKNKTVRVVLKKVRVSETNKDGQAWDISNGKPDLVVRVKNLSDTTIKEFVSQEMTDTFEATYDVATILAVEGQRLQIEVVDKDVVIEDLIGRTNITLTADMIKKGNTELSFDLVKSLTLEFHNP
jgi:hypothetical protein